MSLEENLRVREFYTHETTCELFGVGRNTSLQRKLNKEGVKYIDTIVVGNGYICEEFAARN